MPLVPSSQSPRPTRRARLVVAAAVAGTLLAGGAVALPVQASGRVDTYTPVFTHSLNITNPLFPISRVDQFIQIGVAGPEAHRSEVTLLSETKPITLNGRVVDAKVVQFIAYADGRVIETAFDYFAQDDRGAVWYLGEEVSNYEDGQVINHDGSWLAGLDGPPGMIMPARPRAGDVFRPENIPGLVFEETTVLATGVTVAGPRGAVAGAVRVIERAPGAPEEIKVFAPGYGEFKTDVASEDEHTKIALALPTDARRGGVPSDLALVGSAARRVFDVAPNRNWSHLASLTATVTDAAASYASRPIPPILASGLNAGVAALNGAVGAHKFGVTRTAAINVIHTYLDLAEQYRDVDDTDEGRVVNWRRQLTVDTRRGNEAGIASDRAILAAIEGRISGN